MLSIIPKTDNITNTVSLVDENLLKVIIHINVAINNKIIIHPVHLRKYSPFMLVISILNLHTT